MRPLREHCASGLRRDCGFIPSAQCGLILGSMILLSSPLAVGERWVATSGVSATETYTNNVNLTASGQQQNSFVTSVSPYINIRGEGARLRLNANAAVS